MDASIIGLGAILTQEDQEGTEKVIAYGIQGTRGAEKKYIIVAEQISFLGFIIDRQGLQMDLAKVEVVATFSRPTNKTEV